MIQVHRLQGKRFLINCELIKFVESTPDTMLTLTTGEKIMVAETAAQIVERTVAYRRRTLAALEEAGEPAPAEAEWDAGWPDTPARGARK